MARVGSEDRIVSTKHSMSRLVVNPDSPEAWEIQLAPGATLLGRSEENDFPLDHPSVSSSHCQIIVSGEKATIKDLGSTSGTFVEGELVEEKVLRSGQTIQLGDVVLRFEGEPEAGLNQAPARPPQPGPAADEPPLPVPLSAPAGSVCKVHARILARYACASCGQTFCDLCVNSRREGGGVRKFCRACGGECVPVRVPLPETRPPAGFFKQLPWVFGYPLMGDGLILLVAGSVVFAVLNAAAAAAMFGIFGLVALLILTVVSTGYLFNYCKRIITSTAEGESEPPDWPDFSDWSEDILVPFGQFLALVVLAFGPTVILSWWHPFGETYAGAAAIAAAVLGALLAPMGMLTLAMFDSVGALNPIALFWSISRVPLPYLVAAAAFELVLAARLVADAAIAVLLPIPFVPRLLSAFLGLYLLLAGMRILGLLYVTQKQKLGWFSR